MQRHIRSLKFQSTSRKPTYTHIMTHIKVPASLLRSDINGYSDAGEAAKTAFHKEGKAFLKKLAAELDPQGADGGSIRNNQGGIAGSGEVTLHSDHFYAQLSESCMSPGVQLLFRSCKSNKDYSGNQNNMVNMKGFADASEQERIIQTMLGLIETEKSRKLDQVQDNAEPRERQRG